MKKVFSILLVMVCAAVVFTGCSKEDEPDPMQVAYDSADASKGGILYDKFWATEAGFNQSDANITTISAKSDFFRCKQCHAWDGLGNSGSYISRGPKTTRPNISGVNLYQLAQSKSFQELHEGMTKSAGRRPISTDLSTYDPATNNTEGDKMPDLSEILTEAQIWDLVKFMKEGMFDVSNLYDASYTGTYPTGKATFTNVGKGGNEAAGITFYSANCAACHGADGKTIALEGMSVGKFTRSKPNEVQHKVKYGQLGSIMTGHFDMTVNNMKDLYKALSNSTKYPD